MPQARTGTSVSVRPVLQAIARIIAADRRPVVLATDKCEVLLANAPANRLGLDEAGLARTFDWRTICVRAHRAGSIAVSAPRKGGDLEGELVHVPLGPADGYLLRLAETDQEATMLRNRTRTATLMRVAHDLRTPIQSLLATAETVFQDDDGHDAQADKLRAGMRHAAQQTLDHIDNVLSVIRGEASASNLHLDEDFSLTDEFNAIIDLIAPLVRHRGAKLEASQQPEGALRAHGPVGFVRALLQNLIDNSAKHGGDLITVHLRCDPPQPPASEISVLVEVADQGGGLPEAQKTRLQQALGHTVSHGENRAAISQQPGGRPSAGLNVMAYALRQLGGRMEILDRGTDGKPASTGATVSGTILRVRFTLAAPVTTQSPPADVAQSTPTLAGLGILVIEDSPASRDWLTHTLTAAGADVLAVGSGIKALKLLQEEGASERFDVLLSDMTLPYMSGVDLLREITIAQAAGTLTWRGKMLGLTAHADETLRSTCLGLGMAQVLEKPIRNAQLCAAIHKVAHDDTATEAPKATAEANETLDHAAVAELVAQMGLDGTRNFMERALAEAQAAWSDIEANGIREDTGRMLHAATGACGLTGLIGAERSLRQIELCIESPDADRETALSDLHHALRETRAAIGKMEDVEVSPLASGSACAKS